MESPSIEIQTFRSDFETAAYSYVRYVEDLFPPETEDFAMYFERTYIGQYSASDVGKDELHPLHLTWREPPFPPSI